MKRNKARAVAGAVIAAGLVVSVLAGCDSIAASTSSAKASLDVESQKIGLPLDEYFLTDQESQLVIHANTLIMEDCLAAQNFPYPAAETNWERPAHVTDRRYGIWNLASAANYGYELPDDDSRSPAANPEPEPFTAEGYDNAVMACFETVQPETIHEYLMYQSDGSIADRGLFESQTRAAGDSAWGNARADWIDCMAELGVQMEEGESAWVPILPQDAEAQIEVALVDVQCKDENNTVQRLADLEAKYQGEFEDENQAQLVDLKKDVAQSVVDAQSVIDTHE